MTCPSSCQQQHDALGLAIDALCRRVDELENLNFEGVKLAINRQLALLLPMQDGDLESQPKLFIPFEETHEHP